MNQFSHGQNSNQYTFGRNSPFLQIPKRQNSEQFENNFSQTSLPHTNLSSFKSGVPPINTTFDSTQGLQKEITEDLMKEFLNHMKQRVVAYASFDIVTSVSHDQGKDAAIVEKLSTAIDAFSFKPTKNLIRAADSHSSWSMTDKEINSSPIAKQGADLNQRFEDLADLKDITRSRIGVLSYNTITKSSERLKIYTCLYIVVSIYLFMYDPKRFHDVDEDNRRFIEIVDEILTSFGMTGRTLLSAVGSLPGARLVANNLKKNTYSFVKQGGKSRKRKTGVKSHSRKRNITSRRSYRGST